MDVADLLTRCPVLMIDMCGCIMFQHDRFATGEDYFATYEAAGGSDLSPDQVATAIRSAYRVLAQAYADLNLANSFPSVRDVLKLPPGANPDEARRLTEVFATHECGRICMASADTLVELSRSHRLVLVTNVWSPPGVFVRELSRAGVYDLFCAHVFSSELGCIKPSPKVFLTALARARAAPAEVLFIGDDLHRDIRPARSLGMSTLWISETPHGYADASIPSIASLARRRE